MAIRNDIRARGARGSLVQHVGDFRFGRRRQATGSVVLAREDDRRDRMVQLLSEAEELLNHAEIAEALGRIQEARAELAGGAS